METTKTALTAVVIDNDPDLRRFLAALLAGMGYQVHTARTASEGIRLTRKHHPELITTERHLPPQPGVPGTDVVDALREIQTFSDAYILIIAASTDPFELCMGLETVADDYLVKPVSALILRARVTALARRPRNKKPAAPARGLPGV